MISVYQKLVVLVALMLLTMSSIAHAQVDKTSEKYLDNLGRLFALNQLLNNLSTDRFANELEMTDEQRVLFKKLQREFMPIMSKAVSKSTDPIQFEKDWNNAVNWMDQNLQLTNKVLLPHQRLRYKAIRSIEKLGLGRSPEGFARKKMSEFLDLTEEQKAEIKKITDQLRVETKEVTDEVNRKKDSLKNKCRKESLELLDNDQLAKLKEMFGTDFCEQVFGSKGKNMRR